MARQHKALSGGVIVLCLIFLLAPAVQGQNIVIKRRTFVISGAVGLPGVTMNGLPGAPMTDENGVYSAEVEYGFSGTVAPVKLGYVFEPKQRVYQKVKANHTDESYAATLLTFTISGTTGLPGVMLRGLPDDPISDENGRYSVKVSYGWSGVVVCEKTGYRFEPPSKMYESVIKDYTNESYKAHELTFTISGSVGADGVMMKGLPGNIVTSGGGTYRVDVPYGWTGTVTPMKEGHSFVPPLMEYPAVMSAQTNQDYTASVYTYKISGTTNLAGVTLKGLPGDPISDAAGFYEVSVPHGWSGKVVPEKNGYKFTPSSKPYAAVKTPFESQDYNAEIIEHTISGNAGGAGITLAGLPGTVVSDARGFYTAKVEYGWSGTVTPTKEGWYFEPSEKILNPMTSDQANVNFRGQRITYKISGNAGLPGVLLEGLPGRPTSGADGSYSAVVDYKWNGKVTPRKAGYSFSPEMREYADVLAPEVAQDFTAMIMQHAITGRIVGEDGPIADVLITTDTGESVTTDTTGAFQLNVNHGTRGKLTPQRDGYTFTPSTLPYGPVVQAISNQKFTGRIKMLGITNAILFNGTEPIQGVTVTANPGGYKAVTNVQGKYTVRVPYGWTGNLTFEKEEFEIPTVVPYTNVTEDIDPTAPKPQPVTPPVTPPVDNSGAGAQPVTPPVTSPTTDSLDAERQDMVERIRAMQAELDRLQGRTTSAQPDRTMPPTPPTGGRITTSPGLDDSFPDAPPLDNAFSSNLLDVLTSISQKTGVRIAVDSTVKSVPVSVNFDWTGMSVPMALQRIVQPAGYTFRAQGDAYLVYKGITNTFIGDDLRQALQDVAMEAGVTIVSDPNVAGEVYAELQNVPLESALRIMLAGSPFVVKVEPDHYLVADRGVESDAFPDISETHNIWLNYAKPERVVAMLSPAFAPYVKADPDPNSHFVSVTADPALARRIIEDIKRLDPRPKHVLLDARIVIMERTDLLDVGVEWTMPTLAAGAFGTSFDTDTGGSWPWGVQIGYTGDQTFTNSLLAALNLLKENGQADIVSNPQTIAQDGKMSEMRVMTEEYYMLTAPVSGTQQFFSTTEQVTIESGTKLAITPRIGDNNDITLEMAVEVSDSIPAASETQLPVVTRRTARNTVTVENGGTVAVAGLTENRSKKTDTEVPGLSGIPLLGNLFKNKSASGGSKEIAVFVTAHLVPAGGQALVSQVAPRSALPGTVPMPAQPPLSFEDQLKQSLNNSSR